MYIYIYTPHIFFIYSSINGHLGSFHTLAIVDSAAINMGVPGAPGWLSRLSFRLQLRS